MADETTGLLVTYVEEAKQFRDVGRQLWDIKEKIETLSRRITDVRDRLSAKASSHSSIVNALLNNNIDRIKIECFSTSADGKVAAVYTVSTKREKDIEGIQRIMQLAFENDIAAHMNELREVREALSTLTTDIIPDVSSGQIGS